MCGLQSCIGKQFPSTTGEPRDWQLIVSKKETRGVDGTILAIPATFLPLPVLSLSSVSPNLFTAHRPSRQGARQKKIKENEDVLRRRPLSLSLVGACTGLLVTRDAILSTLLSGKKEEEEEKAVRKDNVTSFSIERAMCARTQIPSVKRVLYLSGCVCRTISAKCPQTEKKNLSCPVCALLPLYTQTKLADGADGAKIPKKGRYAISMQISRPKLMSSATDGDFCLCFRRYESRKGFIYTAAKPRDGPRPETVGRRPPRRKTRNRVVRFHSNLFCRLFYIN